jgi:hypothetical protein
VTRTMVGGYPPSKQCQAFYEFTPIGSDSTFVLSLDCKTDHLQMSAEQFLAVAEQPGYAKVMDLADRSKPASVSAKQEGVDIDTAVAKASGPVLPAGYGLRLSTTNLIGTMDLVGPGGVVTGFDWHLDKPGRSSAESCPTAMGNTGCSQKKVAGGKLYEGHVNSPGDYRTGYAFVPDGADAKEVWVELDSAESAHPMTADQFLAMAKTPGIEQAISAVSGVVRS